MADITLTYKGAQIAETSVSGTKTLKTAGKYCEDDIVLNYVRPSGGASASIVVTSEAGATLTCGSQTYQLGASETTHTFTVALGTYTVTATKGAFTKSATVVADVADASYSIELVDSRLPDGYTELTYIESTGTQYINTQFAATTKTKFEINAAFTNVTDNEIMGSFSQSVTNNRFQIGVNNSTTFVLFYGSSTSSTSLTVDSVANFHKTFLDLLNNQCGVDDSVTAISTDFVGSNIPIYLFARNLSGSVNLPCKCKLKSAKIYDNGTAVRNFIPCIRMSDGEVGMYDLVTNTFFGNSGTGSFRIGGVVDSAFNGTYQQVEYLENSGTQYIDTGLVVNANQCVEVDCMTTTADDMPFGVSSQTYNFRVNDENGSVRFYYGTNKYVASASIRTRLNIKLDKNKAYTNGALAYTFPVATPTVTLNIFIMAASYYLSPGVVGIMHGKMYNAKILDNGTQVRNLVPCFRKSDNVRGMYDLVGRQFYTNAGTGTFSVGADIDVA